jgi:hypothetical protein
LQRMVCQAMNLGNSDDSGQFPDVACQLLEVKLQTSPTIDLGLVSPDDKGPLSRFDGVRHCDVRYSVVYGEKVSDSQLKITDIVVVTGEDFFAAFRRFEGSVTNSKLQIPLPDTLFRDSK